MHHLVQNSWSQLQFLWRASIRFCTWPSILGRLNLTMAAPTTVDIFTAFEEWPFSWNMLIPACYNETLLLVVQAQPTQNPLNTGDKLMTWFESWLTARNSASHPGRWASCIRQMNINKASGSLIQCSLGFHLTRRSSSATEIHRTRQKLEKSRINDTS